jgi:hypothetical protein
MLATLRDKTPPSFFSRGVSGTVLRIVPETPLEKKEGGATDKSARMK